MANCSKDMFVSLEILEDEINKIESKKDKTIEDKKLLSYMTREYDLLSHICLNGVNRYGCTVDEFKDRLKEKPNILIFSNSEVERLNKALKIMELL